MPLQNARNLRATLPYPPWTNSLDWDLQITVEWERRIPFYAYVQHNTHGSCGFNSTYGFPQFSALPTEIQLRILALCPTSTLFQIMQVSLFLRTEASKLFWADPNAYFLVKTSWLLDGGYPGGTNLDLLCLQYVQKVQIDYPSGSDDILCPDKDGSASTLIDRITRFWKSLGQRLPNAREVVVVQNLETPWWWEDDMPVAYPLRMLLQACPSGIKAAAVVLGMDRTANDVSSPSPDQKWQRSLYQRTAHGNWIKSHKLWHIPPILVPVKQFNGPVGRFQKLAHDYERLLYYKCSLWPLIIEALDRHHFDKGRNTPFACPVPGCNFYITEAGAWTSHAVELHCDAWSVGDPVRFLPDELRAVFKQRYKVLAEKESEIGGQYRKLYQDWNTPGKQKRKEIQHSWMNQLRNDPAWDTGKKPGESRLWSQFWQQMSSSDRYKY
ncbi:hypothetical protein DE146DRAFT_662975 [Phaeosphaeria sp. MPI-PUGE-AT-0046c]|nr:hypothetical protein DE146DRAFT_662975 [Phaeosphaeria sp. MPI-PUGE-AT-0046c]